MDIGQNNSQDIIIRVLGFISICLASIYYALKISETLNIITGLIIIVFIIISGLIIFGTLDIITGLIVIIFIIICGLIIFKKARFPKIGKKGIPPEPQNPEHHDVLSNISHHRNPNFFGRETYLTEIQSMLNSSQSDTRKLAICGLGGVGKTQLAIEYYYKNRANYKIIWWVHSEMWETLASDYAGLADELKLPVKGHTDQSVVIKAVRRWLEHNSGWLLIFDNAQKQEDLINYLPQGNAGHVIITSRNQTWDYVNKLLSIDVLSRAESIDFLLKRTELSEKEDANKLAEDLGDLPLALEQAGAYIKETKVPLTKYTELFQSKHEELWRNQRSPPEYKDKIDTTWNLAIDQIRAKEPNAANLLNLCAFFAPDDIPLKLFSDEKKYFPDSIAVAATDLEINEAIKALRRYSLLTVSNNALSIHRLVQTVVRDNLEERDKNIWTETALRIISNAFPIKSDDPESIYMQTWLDCSRLLPHALAASKHAEILEVAPGLTSNILNQAGSYLREISDLKKAKELHEKALKLAENFYGEKHHRVAICLENLGRVLRDLGELKAAKEHYEKALKIYEPFYDPKKHPHIAICEDGLGRVLFEMNELTAAKEHFERALKIDEFIHQNDSKVAIRLNNIGTVLRNQGKLEAAKEHYEKAIKIDKASYDIGHPYFAIRLNNIGTVLHDQGEPKAAVEHYEKAIKIDEAFYGPDNINITTSLNNLGCALLDIGDPKGAKVNFERALKILEKVYDPDHPEIAKLSCNLGFLLLKEGDIKGAKEHFERAMQIHNSHSKDYPCPVNVKKILELFNSRQDSFLLGLFYPIKNFIFYKKFRKWWNHGYR
ncbi:MAG: FxSxx-COOH system tetratricopeptide repeat protein [Candidatus Methanoperedens sp.]|nr:FxSxx-COOH system tetratricopeptide repeat protein [Candidatus Methanoperedens sp.]